MLYYATEHDKSTVWFIAPTYKQAKLIMWQMLADLVPMEIVESKNEQELKINLINGSHIVLKGADNPDSLRGVHIDFCVFDETAFIKKWEFVWNVVRPTLIDSKADCWFISTPNGMNHFKDLYDTQHPDWASFHYTSYDNPYLDPKEIDEARVKMTPEAFAQEFLGEFMMMAGLFFKEFKRELHVVNSFIPPKGSTIIGGLDWGYVDPFCVSFDEIKRIEFKDTVFYRTTTFLEIYGTGKDPSVWANEIKDKLRFFNLTLSDITNIRADTQIFNRPIDSHSKSIANLFIDVDARYQGLLKHADKDRIHGWAVVHNWLSIAPDGMPYHQLAENCIYGIKEYSGAYHDENIVEDISKDCLDHFLDQDRYKLRGLKWIDAKVGGVGGKEKAKTLPMVMVNKEGKPLSVNTDKFK